MLNGNQTMGLKDMLRLNGEWLVVTMNNIGFCEGVFESGSQVGETTSGATASYLSQLVETFPQIEVPATVAAAKLANEQWKKGVSIERMRVLLQNVVQNIRAELQGRTFFIMTLSEHAIYKHRSKPFGDGVFDTFPEIRDDLEEATVCLALDRTTASVFHLMRAMEKCVGRVSHSLSGVHVQKVWGFMLADIKNAIDLMPKGKNKSDWLRAHSLLFAVKEAWRNDVMHPKQSYTAEQAREVFEACKAFTRHLAALLPPVTSIEARGE